MAKYCGIQGPKYPSFGGRPDPELSFMVPVFKMNAGGLWERNSFITFGGWRCWSQVPK